MTSGCVPNAQLSTKLKVGVMWDHNGTYMEGLGFHYRGHKVVVELDRIIPDHLYGERLKQLLSCLLPDSCGKLPEPAGDVSELAR
jgi:hypothetical protein